jgi:DNA-directed RNA polymerase specialized sigma24 family protein
MQDYADQLAALQPLLVIIEVERCLQSLPATQARAFVLRHGEEEDTGAICAELGVSRTNLHVLLHRARNHLRAAMAA